jgi:hypothetical protein
MDGDVCPLEELLDVASEVSEGQGNIQFVVDEAHSVGVIGPKGAGLVCHLGLEKEVAVVVHSFGKAMGATGGKCHNASLESTSSSPSVSSRHTGEQNSQVRFGEFWKVCHIHNGTIVPLCRRHQGWVLIARYPHSGRGELPFVKCMPYKKNVNNLDRPKSASSLMHICSSNH